MALTKRTLWLFALALGARALLLTITFVQRDEAGLRQIAADAPTYIAPARSLLRLGSFREYGDAASPPMHSRTPGYPLFLAAHYAIFGVQHASVLVTQALLGAATALVVYTLARRWLSDEPPAALVGLLACITPAGIVVVGIPIADLVFYALFALGLLAFTEGIRIARRRWMIAAGLLWGAACLTHPRLLLFLPVITLLGWLLSRHFARRVPWLGLLAATGVFCLFPLAWAARNYRQLGLLSVCTTGSYNLKYHLAVDMQTGSSWDASRKVRARWLRADERLLRHGMSVRDLDRKRLRDAWQIIRGSPLLAARTYVRSSLKYLVAPGSSFPHLLPPWPWPSWVSWLRAAFRIVARVEMLIGLVGLAALWRRQRWLTLALVVLVGYFLAVAALGSRQGGRMLLPAEPAYLILFAVGLQTAWHGVRRLFRRDSAESPAAKNREPQGE